MQLRFDVKCNNIFEAEFFKGEEFREVKFVGEEDGALEHLVWIRHLAHIFDNETIKQYKLHTETGVARKGGIENVEVSEKKIRQRKYVFNEYKNDTVYSTYSICVKAYDRQNACVGQVMMNYINLDEMERNEHNVHTEYSDYFLTKSAGFIMQGIITCPFYAELATSNMLPKFASSLLAKLQSLFSRKNAILVVRPASDNIKWIRKLKNSSLYVSLKKDDAPGKLGRLNHWFGTVDRTSFMINGVPVHYLLIHEWIYTTDEHSRFVPFYAFQFGDNEGNLYLEELKDVLVEVFGWDAGKLKVTRTQDEVIHLLIEWLHSLDYAALHDVALRLNIVISQSADPILVRSHLEFATLRMFLNPKARIYQTGTAMRGLWHSEKMVTSLSQTEGAE